MRTRPGKVFRRLTTEGMAERFPQFRAAHQGLTGARLFVAKFGESWGQLLFEPDRMCDMFTIEVGWASTEAYPLGRYAHGLDEWRRSVDSCIRVGRLANRNLDLWWSPLDPSRAVHLRMLADGTYPAVDLSAAGMPAAVSSALDFVGAIIIPEFARRGVQTVQPSG